jgi:anaerobic selenocysteine-containing dehydrogenase
MFRVTTRRGKQFNSMLWSDTDPLTGAGRDAVYLDRADARELGVGDGDRVVLAAGDARMEATVRLASLPRGNAQVHWPEGNVLLPGGPDHREPAAGIPDYQALVSITPRR